MSDTSKTIFTPGVLRLIEKREREYAEGKFERLDIAALRNRPARPNPTLPGAPKP